jgi:hypothetical protein
MFKAHPFLQHILGNAFIFVTILSVLTGACNTPVANHATWQIIPGKNSRLTFNELHGVTAITNNNVWAVGESFGGNSHQSLIEHWNGKVWQIVPTPDRILSPTLQAVAALPGTDRVWAVGSQYTATHGYQPLIEHWNGKVWQIVSSPLIKDQVGSGTNTLQSVLAISKDNAWATGIYSNHQSQTALIEHWNGKQWSIVPGASVPGNPQSTNLTGMTALSANNIWAVGTSIWSNGYDTFKTLTEHWDGHTWHYVPAPNPGTGSNILHSVTSIPGTNQLLAVGELDNTNQRSQILTERWNGKSWQVISSTNGKTLGTALVSVTARSAFDAWAVGVGTGGLIAHWDGTNWNIVSHPTPAKLAVFSAITSVPKTNTFWTVGSYNATASITPTLIERYS